MRGKQSLKAERSSTKERNSEAKDTISSRPSRKRRIFIFLEEIRHGSFDSSARTPCNVAKKKAQRARKVGTETIEDARSSMPPSCWPIEAGSASGTKHDIFVVRMT